MIFTLLETRVPSAGVLNGEAQFESVRMRPS